MSPPERVEATFGEVAPKTECSTRTMAETAAVRKPGELPRFVLDLLAAPPQRGEGLNNWFYRVARVMHPYRTREEIINTLMAAAADQPIQRGEIERAVDRSAATAWQPGQPVSAPLPRPWPALNCEQRETIISRGLGLADLWNLSPERFDDAEPHTEYLVDHLFPGNPLLCVGQSKSKFATRPREQWRGRLASTQFIVPSPMSARVGRTQDGEESEHTLENTGPRRFLVIEQDSGTADEQSAVLLHLAEHGPLALAVHSGGKSIHGWFMVAGQPEDRTRRFMRYAVAIGADPRLWTRSQFTRIPDGVRDGRKRQTVYFFNPGVIR